MNPMLTLAMILPAQAANSDPFEMYELLIALAVVIGGAIYFWMRSRRMRSVLDAPETEGEKAARLQLPPGIKDAATADLVAGLREDLRNADSYLETAERALRSSTSLALLDVFGYEGSAGEGGPKQDTMAALFNDLMQADRFLTDARHRLHVLGERTDLESPLLHGGADVVTLDWVADNPLADFVTYRRLKKLKPKLEKLRTAVVQLRAKVGPETSAAG